MCGRVIRGGPGPWAKHMKAHIPAGRNGPVLLPDGRGFLKRAFASGALQSSQLAEISRFGAMVRLHAPFRPKTRGPWLAKQQAAAKWAEDNQDRAYGIQTQMPGELHAQVYKLACLAGVSLRTMYAVLLLYGLSHLSTELRDARKAPPVRGPKSFMDKLRDTDKEDITPKTTKAHARLLKVPEDHNANAGIFPKGNDVD
jgi:hypothetical protein